MIKSFKELTVRQKSDNLDHNMFDLTELEFKSQEVSELLNGLIKSLRSKINTKLVWKNRNY